MALGKNMKVDRLIPLKKEDKALEAIPPVAQEEITPAELIEKLQQVNSIC